MKEKIQQDEFLKVYNLYKNKLFASSLKIVHDKHAAEDILQEAFFRLTKQDYTKIKDRIDLWLFTVCRNLSIKYYHKQGRVSLLGEEMADEIEDEQVPIPDTFLMSKERVQKLLKFYRKIPKRQLQAIKMRYYKDMDYSQIAKKLKTSSGNIGFMLSTGISSLRSLFLKEKKNQIEY